MNTKIIIGFAIAAMATACVVEEPFEETTKRISDSGKKVTFSAVNADNPTTKTSLSDDGLSVLWNPGDAINLFYGETGSIKLTADIESPSSLTTFSGTLGDEDESMTGNENIWAVYPYNEANTCDGESVTITIPNEQVAVEGSFDKDALVTVAHSSGSNLEFYNVCGGIKFRFTHEGFNEVNIYGTWAEVIAGTIKVTMDADGKPIYSIIDGKSSITAIAPDEEGFKVGSWYYVAALPTDFEDGVRINVSYENFFGETKTETRTLEDHLAIKRSVWSRLTFTNEEEKPQLNQIWYKSSFAINQYVMSGVYDQTFSDGHGIITFYENVTSITTGLGLRNIGLTEMYLPDGVTSIGVGAFQFCSDLTSINIPSGVTNIGGSAFSGCSSLSSIYIPDGVTSIESGVFEGCSSLTSINIPDGITSIGANAFNGCEIKRVDITNLETWCKISWDSDNYINNPYQLYLNGIELTDAVIPATITNIGDYAFYGCSSLSSVNIPDGVTDIGNYAFYGCSSLSSINIPDGVTRIGNDAFRNCSSLTSINIPDGVVRIGNDAFNGCKIKRVYITNLEAWCKINWVSSDAIDTPHQLYLNGVELTDVVIPDTITKINTSAFHYCSGLTSITIPDGVTSIGFGAFRGCSSLSSIYIPDGVTSIDMAVFEGCSSLSSINIPVGVTRIGGYAFRGCSSLSSIYIPDGVTSIEDGLFGGCSGLTSIKIPDGVTSIGDYSFNGCSSLSSINIPDGVTSIGSYSFNGCSSLSSINIPDGVTSIGSHSFNGCSSLSSINIPDGVTDIGDYAFYGCSGLTSIKIPDRVTSIGIGVFYECSNAKRLSIGAGVTTIGDIAFERCRALETIVMTPTTPPSLGSHSFNDTGNCTIYVPSNSLSAYKAASGWGDYAERLAGI
ncbi:MAG: leucine-rich repeat domain-containing protein [Bacteroidales bacterium]|nr:leucine-rich repeat domain-containing protein [Bacteroidales bacterium]